jgi:hypothetical protein
MISGDRRAWNAMRAAVDEYSQMVSKFGSAVVHARDENTGFPLDLTQRDVRSGVWGNGSDGRTLAAHRGSRAIAETDNAHWPAIGYLDYLLTAESNSLENVQHSAIQAWLNEGPGGETGTLPSRGVRWTQVRGLAWTLREMVNGAIATPEAHPLKAALQAGADRAIDGYTQGGLGIPAAADTGLWLASDHALPYGDRTQTSAWMQDFLTWAVGDAYERGWRPELDQSGFWLWKAQAVVGRFATDPSSGWCWNEAAIYGIRLRDANGAPFYESWPAIFSVNFPDRSSCATPGTTDAGVDRSAMDYGAQIGPALATAANTGVPGAEAAWTLYDSRSLSWNSSFTSEPEWAIDVRQPLVPRPRAPSALRVE